MNFNPALRPIPIRIVARTTATTASESITFTAPMAQSYGLYVATGTGTGTNPTLDVVLQHTPDGGTTWITAPIRFTQATTTATAEVVTFRIGLGDNEAAFATTSALTGGTLAKSFVPSSMNWRLTLTMGGTGGPSYASLTAYLFTLS